MAPELNKNMEKIKRKRSTLKGICTKLMNKIHEMLANEEVDIKELEDYRERLIFRESEIFAVELEIENLIEDLDELEKEIETRQDYRDEIFQLKIELHRKIKKTKNESLPKESEPSQKESEPSQSVTVEKNVNLETELPHCSNSFKTESKLSVKLPKLIIEKYSGDPESWPEFWAQFNTVIHNNEHLTSVDKFTYLKSYLSGSALTSIQGILVTEENYKTAIDILTRRYGRKEIIVRCRLDALLNLSPVRNAYQIKELRGLYDTLEINIRSLQNLGIDLNSYGNLLFPIVTKLIPSSIMLDYNKTKIDTDEWDVADLLNYIKIEVETREKTLMFSKRETVAQNSSGSYNFPVKGDNRNKYKEEFAKRNQITQNRNSTPKISAFNVAINRCVFCTDSAETTNTHHESKFCKLSIEEKKLSLRKQGVCFLCFKRGYHVAKYCTSKIRCETCGGKHNSLICFKINVPPENNTININPNQKNTTQSKNEINTSSTESESISTYECSIQTPLKDNEILLQTCFAKITNNSDSKICTLLLDNASQRSFITRHLANELKLSAIRQETLEIYPFACTEPLQKTYDVVNFSLFNINNPRKYMRIEALIVEAISGTHLSFPNENIRRLLSNSNKSLSSLLSCKRRKPDILLGAEYFWVVNEGKKQKINNTIFAVLTTFGWTLQGRSNEVVSENKNISIMKLECCNFDLRAFWDIESMGLGSETDNLKLDKEFIQRAENNLTFKEGRYHTGLLWKSDKMELQNNFGVAKRRFESLRRKLDKNIWEKEKYQEIVKDQLEKGIVEECINDITDNSYYMPHRSVIRTDKKTSPVRIVYDASSKADDCLSLNDCLVVGPNMNPKVLDVILRFRRHKIAFCADIEKAFLMIGIREEDRNYLKFFWFPDNPNDVSSHKILRMTRLPFGMSSSPFILALTIKHHIKKYEIAKNDAFKMLNSSLYVDDLFYGSDSLDQAFNLSSDAKNILKDAAMNLRKFKTNSPELRRLWIEKGIDMNEDAADNILKVLGICWNIQKDYLQLDIQSLIGSCENVNVTKRNVLRTVAKIFDPAGFITPFTVRAKCILQEIWETGVHWDEILPFGIKQQWEKWYSEIEQLSTIKINRKYSYPVNFDQQLQLHIFSDASPKAYGAVAYFRFVGDDGGVTTSFIMSKSRVAPLKRLTLPRLELMGALVAVRMFEYLKSVFEFRNIKVHFWSDSYITLYWIKGSARNWKPFVANRVIEIQTATDPKYWKHCKGNNNPADYITRGEDAASLKSNNLWWHGPAWLLDPEHLWPKTSPKSMENDLEDEKKTKPERIMQFSCQVDPVKKPILNLKNYSEISKVLRITSWVKRFIYNSKSNNQRKSGPLTAEEINDAEIYWLKLVQEQNFNEELNCLKKKQEISKHSSLLNFDPFLDSDNIIRIGGRLQKAKFKFDEKHPVLLPSNTPLAELLVRQAHEKVLHFGINDTLVELRERFWILRGRQIVKNILGKCIICRRYNSRSGAQIMAPLPEDRLDKQPPFAVTGLDFGGPVFVKNSEVKHYISLCTCAVTRAIHLELIDSLSTETFLLAFRRFVARRGLCHTVYSDNAKTFHRADLELRTIWKIIKHPDVKSYYASHQITWKFIVEKAAWWGGFYERMIGSVKVALRKIVGKTSLTAAQLVTVLSEIEAIVNSRPLTYVYSNADEPSALTPAHFLVGRRLTSLPAVHITRANFPSSTESFVKRFNYKEKLLHHFWTRWKKEYILQLRSAIRTQPSRILEFKVDDVVLIHEDKTPRNLWKLGRVIEVFLGRDGRTRSCMVKTKSGVLKRPIQLLFPLELKNSD